MTRHAAKLFLGMLVLVIAACANPFLPAPTNVELTIVPAEAEDGLAVRIENHGPGPARIAGCGRPYVFIDRMHEGRWNPHLDQAWACLAPYGPPPPLEAGEVRYEPLLSLQPGVYRVRIRYGPGRGHAQSAAFMAL